MVRVISERERESNKEEWLKDLAQQTHENKTRKEMERLEKKRVSPPPEKAASGPLENLKTGRRTLDTINQFERTFNYSSNTGGGFQGNGRASRVEAYANQNQNHHVNTDFFWEARMAGANRDNRSQYHPSPVPSHSSHGTYQKQQMNYNAHEGGGSSAVRYSRMKTDLRADDPDAELKMEANRVWRESIENQIQEKKRKELMEKQREELEESMRYAKFVRQREELEAANMSHLKPTAKPMPPIYLGPVPDIEDTQKAYFVTKEQMKEQSKIPRFSKPRFVPQEAQKVENTEVSPTKSISLPAIAATKNSNPRLEAVRGLVEKPKNTKSIPDKKYEETLLGVIPGSNPHRPHNYRIPPKNKITSDPAILPAIKSDPPPPPRSEVKKEKEMPIIPAPRRQLEEFAETPIKSKFQPVKDPRNGTKPHQRTLKNGGGVNEMEKLREENLLQLQQLQQVLQEKRNQYAR